MTKIPLSREAYTQRSIERTWPSGEWVELEGPSDGEAEPDVGSQLGSRPSSITVIGGTKYDEDALAYWLSQNDVDIITGVGRGAESSLENVTRIEPGDLPRKVNVEQVLSYDLTSPVLLVGLSLIHI